MIKIFHYTLFITSLLICSCKTNTSNNTAINDTSNGKNVKNTIKEDINGIKGDSLLYDDDEGYNHVEANKAEEFVLKTFKIDTTKVFLPGVVYHKNDDSYVVQVAVDRKEYEVTHSTFYKYFPKTQLVLDAVFYDTLYHNNKLYPKK
jgi:hypothetical protein